MTETKKNRFSYALGLVLYHPEAILLKRIELFIDLGISLYIFDNSPDVSNVPETLKRNNAVHYITAGRNMGIAYPLMTICATAYAHGYERLLYLDQDTGLSSNTLGFIGEYAEALPQVINEQYVALTFKSAPCIDRSVCEVPLVISSGSLFNLPILRCIGWHNPKYFVDGVDYEICLRARRLGYKVGIVNNTPDFDHVTEQPDRKFVFFSKDILIRKYSMVRMVDAVGAYLRLILSGLMAGSLRDTFVLVKSLTIYLLGQVISRIVGSK